MTTTTHVNHSTTTTPAPTKKVTTDTAKKFVFPVALAIAAAIAWVFLFTTGMTVGAMGAFTYPAKAALIIGIYNIVIMAWPVVLAVQKRQLMVLRLLFVAATIVVSLIMLPWLFISAAGLAQALWGLKIFGVLALLLHGLTAYLLTRYSGPDRDVEAERGELRGIADNTRKAEQKATMANKALEAHRLQMDQDKCVHAKLQKTATKRQEAYQHATEVFKKDPLVVERDEAKEKVDAKTAEIAKLDELRDEIQSKIWRSANSNEKTRLQSNLDNLNGERASLTAELASLEANAARLEAEVQGSDIKKQLDAATAAHAKASGAEATQQKDLDDAEKVAKKATKKAGAANATLTSLQTDKDNATTRIEAADKAAKSVWRDVIIWPAVAFIGAFLLYPAWYGWVLVDVVS